MVPKGYYMNTREFAKAIQRATAKTPERQLEYDAAIDMADYILGFFGFQDRIIDNMLEPQDRNVFYLLQDYGLVRTESEETSLWDGREWRIHYWLLDHNKIFKVNGASKELEQTVKSEADQVYDDIPDHFWRGEDEDLSDRDWFLSKF